MRSVRVSGLCGQLRFTGGPVAMLMMLIMRRVFWSSGRQTEDALRHGRAAQRLPSCHAHRARVRKRSLQWQRQA